MAYLNNREAFEDLKNQVVQGIGSHFPMVGKKQSLHLEKLDVQSKDMDSEDVEAQHGAKVGGKSWAAPVMGTMALKDNETGKVIDRKTMRLADIPVQTKRYSYIVDGQEYQVDNQWQLKAGVYTRRRKNGELETRFNSKRTFDVTFDPDSKVFKMERGKSKNIPVYPLMKELGVDDDTLEKHWGKEVLNANKSARATGTALDRFFKADRKRSPKDKDEARKYFHEQMRAAELRPEATEITTGKPFDHVNGDLFTRVTGKMLDVQNGKVPEDERDSLVFKDLRTVADYAREKLTAWNTTKRVKQKADRKINKASSVREVLTSGTFNDHVKSTFTNNSLSRMADQVNPAEMLVSSFQTTITGPGGIQSEQAISDEAKLISPSHLGFLDPINTPEGGKTGVSLHLPMGVKKVGNQPTVPVYNVKTGKTERIDPIKFHKSKVVMPDQVKWKDGKPTPLGKKVQLSTVGNDVETDDFKNADYVMRHSSQLFSATSNLIPFLGNNSGNRASYANQHIKQSISLKERQTPLVQVSTGTDKEGLTTFEEFMGRQSAHVAPTDGEVVSVTSKSVVVRDGGGKNHKVALYDNFPLNDPKAVLHSETKVKPGDKVKAGQTVADNNFTRDGKLALGNNLTVGYVPFKGYNFEDGVVISEAAAKKLTSVHMHKPSLQTANVKPSAPKSFKIHHPEAFTKDQYEKVDDNGMVRAGQKVMPGDPLVLASKPYELKGKMGIGQVRKSLSNQHSNASLTWKSEFPGEVVGVHKDKRGNVQVHVRTEEPMQVGDKLTGRHGNKGIVTAVVPDKEMPHTKDGKPLEVALNPAGIPGRMNMGQVLETAASKIALKTGKPYKVDNFTSTTDQLEAVKSELKKHGLSDTEELIDPVSGKSLGKALVGNQHMLKLKHQIDKKISVRAGNVLEGSEPEYYDLNLIPSGGGKAGAQSMGNLGMYSMLAHGAKHNIREMQTWKSEGPSDESRWKSQHNDVWRAIQTGDPIPPPKKTFAFQKFEDMLRASGVNVEKKGHRLQLSPLTEGQVLSMSAGEIKDPALLVYSKVDKNGEFVPRKGGLFDPDTTGGHGGKKWSHMKLAEPMPNPMFEGAIQKVLGMPRKDYNAVVEGEKAVDKKGNLVPLETPGSVAGGKAIAGLLQKLDVKKELEASKKELDAMKVDKTIAFKSNTTKVDKLSKKVRFLTTLADNDMNAKDAYVIENLPILPPVMRPIRPMPDGSINQADVNGLYSSLGSLNGKMKDPTLRKYMGDKDLKEQRAGMYDGLKALMGVGMSYAEREGDNKGLMLQIGGSSPKQGYFQKTLLSRRQDMTMRSTITPEPGMGLDNVGLPEKKAVELFRPFVTKKLVDLGAATHPLEAQKLLSKKKKDSIVYKALDQVMEERPVLLKRDPSLHKHSVQAYKAHRVPGTAIQIHPLVTGGHNADFDGNCVIGSTLVVVKFRLHSCPDSTAAARRAVSKSYGMKFSGRSRTYLDVDGLVVECRMDEIPHAESYALDKNGAHVHEVLEGVSIQSYDPNTKQPSFEPVTHFTVEGTCATVTVTSAAKREVICSTNETLCVFDYETGTVKRISPAESVRQLMPVVVDMGQTENADDDVEFDWVVGALVSGRKIPSLGTFSKRALLGVLAGLLDGNGSVSITHGKKKPQVVVNFSTSSPYLVRSMHELGMRLGVRTGVTTTKRRLQKHDVYTVTFSTVDLVQHADALVSMVVDGNTKDALRCLQQDVPTKDDRDVVPVPACIMDLLTSATSELGKHEHFASVSTIKSAHKPFYRMSRSLAVKCTELLKRLPNARRKELKVDEWERLVATTSVHWDPVESVRSGATETVYDVCVPTTKIFAVDRGLIVWDTMSVYVPVGKEAVAEAHKMLPSNNLFNEGSGEVIYKPSHESALGLFKMSRITGDSKKKFKDPAEALRAAQSGKVKMTETVQVGSMKTTPGRIMISSAVPETMQKKVLTDHDFVLDKKGIKSLYGDLATKHKKEFGDSSVKLMQLGYDASFGQIKIQNPETRGTAYAVEKEGEDPKNNVQFLPMGTHSLSLDDFAPDKKVRDPIVAQAQKKVDAIKAMPGLNKAERERKIANEWFDATDKIKNAHLKRESADPNNLLLMHQSGMKPTWSNYQQLRIGPMMVADAKNRPILQPITKSYSEGLDVGSYWTQQSGARKGSVLKVQEVQDPGYFTKRLMNTNMGLQVNADDCGTTRGVSLGIGSKDAYDRELVQDLTVKGKTFKAGTVLTPDVVGTIRAANKNQQVQVRSTLKCEHGDGICQKCTGIAPNGSYYDKGTNVGILATQSLGERATQLTLKAFHSGGVATRGRNMVNDFKRVLQLTELPSSIPDAARLSMKSGKIEKIEKDPTGVNVWVGGTKHHVPKDTFGKPLWQKDSDDKSGWKPPKVGMKVDAGQPLSDPSRSFVNPHDLYKATGNMETVQNHLVNELHGIYGAEGVRRQHVETVVKGMSSLTKVVDPGDTPNVVKGEFQATSKLRAENKRLQAQGKKPAVHAPVLKGIDVMPLEVQEDWMAKYTQAAWFSESRWLLKRQNQS